MRGAKRALGERSAHRARLKGATVRSARGLAARRSRRGVAPFRRVVFPRHSPKRRSAAWGYFCSAFHADPLAGTLGGEDVHVFVAGRGNAARRAESFLPQMSRMNTDESPVGAALKETPGGSPGMHAKRKSLVKATLFPRRTDAPGAGSPRRGLSDFPPCPRFPPGVSKRVAPGGGFSKCGRIFKSPDGAELPSVGCQPCGNGNENDARCKCAIAGTRKRGNLPRNSRIDADFLSTNCSNFTNSERRGNAARRKSVLGKSPAAGTKAGMPSPPNSK